MSGTDFEAVFDDAGIDTESLTVVLVRGGTRAEVLTLLGAAEEPVDLDDVDEEEWSAYAAVETAGGVIAFEHTGYADPATPVLAALSGLGGRAAVARSNIQAHERFGCATDGVLDFDAHEFAFVDEDEKSGVPEALRPLMDSVSTDPGDDDVDAGSTLGVQMAALHTGVIPTAADLERAVEAGYHRVPSLTYLS